MTKVSIQQIELSDGSVLELPLSGLTMVVGPNNAGKSTFLKEIDQIAQSGVADHSRRSLKVVKGLTLHKEGSDEDIAAWIEEHAERLPNRSDDIVYGRINSGQSLRMRNILALWQLENKLEGLWRYVAHAMDVNTRINAATSAQQFDPQNEIPSQPLHKFYYDGELLGRLQKKMKDVFGEDLYLQIHGPQLKLLLGKPVNSLTSDGRPTKEYVEELKDLPLLDEQGSGMRSFMYLMVSIMSQAYFCILLDEPEAFLHPPQARALGDSLVNEVDQDSQIIISTHSSDIVRGALNSVSATPMKIVRLTRIGEVNHFKELKHDDIKRLWNDPVLRYSNVLDGLFHEAVVICESDSDCKYYSAIHERLDASDARFTNDNTLYTYAGSKQRVATMMSAVRSIGVPVRASVDIDILNDEGNIKKLVQAAGGDWSLLKSDWTIVDAGVKSLSVQLGTPSAIKQIITHNLEKANDMEGLIKFGKETKELLAEENGWSRVKKDGKSAIPAADATEAYSRLDNALKGLGIHVVPVGELENFVKTIPHHGPPWVDGVFNARLHEDSSNQDALNYVSGLVKK